MARWTEGERVRTVAEDAGTVLRESRGWTTVRLDDGRTRAFRPDSLMAEGDQPDPRDAATDEPTRPATGMIACAECGTSTAEADDEERCPSCAAEATLPRVTPEQAAKLAAKPVSEARPLGTPASRPVKLTIKVNGHPAGTDPRATLLRAAGSLALSGDACGDALVILREAFAALPAAEAPKPSAQPTPREPRPKAAKALRPCCCGCGELVAGSFRMGHDARFHGWMKRIADGKLDPATIAPSAVALMSLVAGKPTTDYDGSPWTR